MAISFRAACAVSLIAAGLSACSVAGPPAGGIVPDPVDMHSALVKPDGSAVLAAPAGWTPAPTITTPVFPVAAPRLLAAMQEILLSAPRTWLTISYPAQEQAFFIVRSYALNLPDIVVVQALPSGDTASKAVIFSQSRYDVVPFLISENEARVRDLISALTRRFSPGSAP
jgi:hypothetical protein